MMLEITLIQDLARKKLHEVPRNVLNMTNLKMLYLEGNSLEDLPSELFILLDKLQWLDVRNNKLTTLPKSVMDHVCLETILLQNNFIELLPLELGFVLNLKVLQLSGNPLKFPKKSVLETGVVGICKFLRNEYILREKHTQKQIAENDSPLKRVEESPITKGSVTKSQPSMPVITLKSFHRMPKSSSRKSRSKNRRMYKSRSKYSMYKDTLYCNSNKYVHSTPATRNDERIKDQIMRDMFMKKMQELLFQQEASVQRNKDKEALKNFRQNSKYRGKQPDLSYRPIVPFDYNNEYDRVPSRKEINSFIEKSRESLRSANYKPKKINVEKLITDIVESLKSMEKERETEKTPRAQMDYAGREIKRILDLQKRLSALKISNDRILL